VAKTPRKNSVPRGHTLIEVMVVVVLMAIIAAIVVPLAINASDQQAVSAARIVTNDLQYAQNESITTQTPVTVSFTPNSNSYQLSNASGALIHPITKSAYVVAFASQQGLGQVKLVSASFGGSSVVTFDAMGSPSGAGTVTIKAGPNVFIVRVAAVTGKVTVSGP